MNDILEWISRNNDAAFVLGLFLLAAIGTGSHFLISLARAFTGHYPTTTVVACSRRHADDEDEDGA